MPILSKAERVDEIGLNAIVRFYNSSLRDNNFAEGSDECKAVTFFHQLLMSDLTLINQLEEQSQEGARGVFREWLNGDEVAGAIPAGNLCRFQALY